MRTLKSSEDHVSQRNPHLKKNLKQESLSLTGKNILETVRGGCETVLTCKKKKIKEDKDLFAFALRIITTAINLPSELRI